VIAYLDTSSLVKLYIEEEGADHVRDLVSAAQLVSTSDVAYPEMRAALARRRRDGSLSPPDFRDAKRALDADWSRYLAVAVTPGLCREAGDLAERHRLRGFDSLHLASFLEVLRTAGTSDVRFSSFDAALNRAAATVRRSRRRMLGSRP
jgi:predicted nucleic acid-binding protein